MSGVESLDERQEVHSRREPSGHSQLAEQNGIMRVKLCLKDIVISILPRYEDLPTNTTALTPQDEGIEPRSSICNSQGVADNQNTEYVPILRPSAPKFSGEIPCQNGIKD